ncbi:MAG: hypothetical protein JXB15_16385 [Anaerolineales bacterium]|nr:hypothetical protein [Anaerolineales bacterium]
MDFTLDQLQDFIVRAKSASYVGSGAPSLAHRPGAHDLEFHAPPFAYLDSYFGGSDFIGEEVVYYQERPVWAMNYYGRILEPTLITGAETGQVIKISLTVLYQQGRFLGGFEHATPLGIYTDTNRGDVASFIGREWITREGLRVYELDYHGGLIKN